MEDNVLEQGLSSENVHNKLSGENLSYLKGTATWTKFLAILSFIGCGFVLIAGLSMVFLMNSFSSTLNPEGVKGLGMLGPGLGIFYLLLAVPFFFCAMFLNRFSNKINSVWRTNSPTDLTDAFRNLRNYFRLNGWMIIGVFIFYIVMLIALAGGAASGMFGR